MQTPLKDRSVLVTRPEHQASELVLPLRSLGAEVFLLPAIGIAPPLDTDRLDRALLALDAYDWVVLTSVNGVEAVRSRMEFLGVSTAMMNVPQVAVVGPSTATAFEEAFRPADAMPGEYVSDAIAVTMGDVRGKRILLARADLARKELPAILVAAGAIIEEVTAYRIVTPEPSSYPLPKTCPDAITLTSSAAARGTERALTDRGLGDWMQQAALVCIGPITAATVEQQGYRPAAVATEYTMTGLTQALVDYFGANAHG